MARPRVVTDEAILFAARHAAVEHGSAVSLDMVADRLGVTAPALLKRFGSRHALMRAALRPTEKPAWIDELAAGPDERPLRDQLEQLLDHMLDFLSGELPCMTALRENGVPLDDIFGDDVPPPVRGLRAIVAWLERARTCGLVAATELETAAGALLGALQGRVLGKHFLKRNWSVRSEHEFVSDLASLFSRALANAPKTPSAPSKRRRPAVRLTRGKAE